MSSPRMALALAALVPALLVPASAFADTVTVTSTADGGAGTLRAAIASAAPGDTIDFAVDGTIALGSELVVDKALRIEGPGARRLDLDGQAATRVLHVNAPGGAVTIAGLTVRNGRADGQDPLGGGVLVTEAASVRLAGVAILDNVADQDEDVVALGGGVAAVRGALEIADSTVAGNRTTPDGGGGGVFVGNPATFVIASTTLAGNTAFAGGGLLAGGSDGVLDHTTFTANAASGIGPAIGAMPGSGVTLLRSLLADGCDGPLASGGGNVGGASCLPAPAASDAVAATQVGALGDNGGPTDTAQPQAGNPAIDHIAGACAPADQRGVARPQGAGCDAGAVELEVAGEPLAPAPQPADPPAPPAVVDEPVASALASLLGTSTRARRSGRFSVRLACVAVNAAACSGKVTLKLSKTRKLTRAFSVEAGKRATVTLRLNRQDRRRLAGKRAIRSAVTVVTRQPDGSSATTHRSSFKLRR